MNIALDHTRRAVPRTRKLWRASALAIAGVAMLAACGDDDASSDATEAPAAAAASESTTPAATEATTPAATEATEAAAPAVDDYGYRVPADTDAPAPEAEGASTVATAETSIGTVLVDARGMTLYAFTEDTAGEPTCLDGCAGAWPPALVEGAPTFGDVDASLFSTVDNPEGTQLKVGDFPLYTFSGDSAPGDVNGQGSGGIWFAVAADGTLID